MWAKLSLGLVAAMLLPGAARAADYGYATFQFPQARAVSVAALNRQGEVVGSWLDGDEHNHGYWWRDGRLTSIMPPGAVSIYGIGINDEDTIVGSFGVASGPDEGFVYRNGVYTIIAHRGVNIEFYGINNHGESVGAAYRYQPGVILPLDNHVITMEHGALSGKPVGSLTVATKLNDSGALIGSYLDRKVGRTGFVAANGVVTPIVIGGQPSYATGINDAGTVVGFYTYQVTLGSTAYIRNHGAITTVRYPGAANTEFEAVNDSGAVAGLAFGIPGSADAAFVYSGGAYQPLGVPGAIVTEPAAINASGQVAGTYFPPSGSVAQVFVATPR